MNTKLVLISYVIFILLSSTLVFAAWSTDCTNEVNDCDIGFENRCEHPTQCSACSNCYANCKSICRNSNQFVSWCKGSGDGTASNNCVCITNDPCCSTYNQCRDDAPNNPTGCTQKSWCGWGLSGNACRQGNSERADDNSYSDPNWAYIAGECTATPQTCSTPSGLSCGTPTSDSITLSWNAVSGATQYTATKCDVNGQNCDGGSTTTSTSKQYTGLSASTTYTLKVKVSSSDATCTSPSSEASTPCTTTSPPTQTPASYTLSVSKSGTGSGTVTSSPAGIDCGTDCSESYNSGTSVTLTATAVSGSTFAGWSGDCSGTGSCSLTMNSAKSATAAFNPATPQGPVTLYNLIDYQGQFQDIPYGTTVKPNFKPKSIDMQTGSVAYLYYGGRACNTFLERYPTISMTSYTLGDSSITTYNSFNGVVMYNNLNYAGGWSQYYPVSNDFSNYGALDNQCVGKEETFFTLHDSISSFKLALNYLVVAYNNANFDRMDGYRVFSSDQSNLGNIGWDNKISSFRVCKQDSTTCVPQAEDTTNPYFERFYTTSTEISTGTELTFKINVADDYWVSKCDMEVEKPNQNIETISMSLSPPPQAFPVPSGMNVLKEGAGRYTFASDGDYYVTATCYDLSGRTVTTSPEIKITAISPAEQPPQPSGCGACSSPRGLGTVLLSNYGDELTVSTCQISDQNQDDIFTFTADKGGYAIISVVDPADLDTRIQKIVKYSLVSSACVGDTQQPVDATDYFNPAIAEGDYSLDIGWVSGSGQSNVKVKLGECVSNDEIYGDTNSNNDRSNACLNNPTRVSEGKTRCDVNPSSSTAYQCVAPAECGSNPDCPTNECCTRDPTLPDSLKDPIGICKPLGERKQPFLCTR